MRWMREGRAIHGLRYWLFLVWIGELGAREEFAELPGPVCRDHQDEVQLAAAYWWLRGNFWDKCCLMA